MKQLLLITTISVGMPLVAQGWNVSTEPGNQNVLIEEFTGIHCPNCPAGHHVASELMAMHPGDIHTVAIHAGAFAIPTHGEPNYITSVGKAVHDHFNPDGGSYPSATVGRQEGRLGLVLGRGSWGSASRDVLLQPSPVNVWSGAHYDENTRTVTLDVECYLTDDMSDPRLNVFMLQSEILGPQSGGQLGTEYPHRHMLRARLTDNDMGDAMDKKSKGEYWSRRFTYVLPADIGGIAVDPRNVEFLAFVTDGEENVRRVSATRLETPGMDPVFSVGCTAYPIAIEKNYAFDYIEVYLHNYGSEPVSTATFSVTINNTRVEREWTGNVPAHSSQVVKVPLEGAWKEAIDNESNRYSYRLVQANGKDVDCTSVSGTFHEIATYPTELDFSIKTDLDAGDNTWRILDDKGEVVKEFGPYENGKVGEYTGQVKLEDGKIYCLEVSDAWGDGICHPSGGWLKVAAANGKPVVQYREIKGYGMRQFFRADATAGVKPVGAGTAVSVEYYDMAGRRLTGPARGVTVVRTVNVDGNVKIEKIIK